ncbi:MAG: 50S ribosomal protein L24 [Acidimicrobiia bacterium]|jgi:large subunit ribosomal protein L24|nr:50S ribosomal protein L24 [Acidimicrobiia bacterium]
MTVPKLKLKKGDRVVVLSGKDIGKEGEITRVIRERDMVIVDGVNVAKKHQRATSATMQGGIIDKDMPIHISNLALLCASCGKTRVGYRFDADGTKLRVCKKCGKDV